MTLLEEFIFSLNKTERSMLRPLQFRGVKRKIFFKVLACRLREGIKSEGILHANKLTKKRYYQLITEILDACYYDIVPEGGTNLLLFLGNKHLFRHFYNEAKKQEGYLLSKKNNRAALEHFYFDILVDRSLFVLKPKSNDKLSEAMGNYAQRYVEIVMPDSEDTRYLQKSEIGRLITKPFPDPEQGFNSESVNHLLSELEDLFEAIKDGDFILAQFVINTRLIWLFSQFQFEGKSPAQYAAFGLKLMKDHPVLFAGIKDFYSLQCLQLLQDEDKNIEEFKNYLMNTSEYFGPSLVHIAHYFSRIVNSGETGWGKKYIEKFFPCNIDLLRDDAAIYYYYMLIVYHICIGQDDQSEKYILEMFNRLKGRNRDINAYLVLRCYNVFFTAMRGDPIALENAVNRNLRFAKLHGYKRDNTSPMLFLQGVNDLLKYIGAGHADAKKILERFEEQFNVNRGLAQFPLLFRKIYNKYFIT
jgi:hypothetical protein